MTVTQKPLIIQYSTPLMTYPHIRTKTILGLPSAKETYYKVR